jgi:hypothetical protein
MKLSLCCATISLFTLSAATATQQPEDQDSCHFKVSESTTKPSITVPEDLVAMTYVIEQPDSPVEILAMDFKDSFLSVAHERVTEELRCTAKIRNRSDQSIRGVDISVVVASGGSAVGTGFVRRPGNWSGLAPGQEGEIQGCGGHGTGSAHDNLVNVLVFVSQVDTGDCSYFPSRRYPRALRVAPSE